LNGVTGIALTGCNRAHAAEHAAESEKLQPFSRMRKGPNEEGGKAGDGRSGPFLVSWLPHSSRLGDRGIPLNGYEKFFNHGTPRRNTEQSIDRWNAVRSTSALRVKPRTKT